MLLIIEALLILATLGQDHRTAASEGHIFPLDMALNSVDDEYDGCTENMTQQVETKYLKRELNSSESDFKGSWQYCEKNSTNPEHNMTKNHSIAICVYTDRKVYGVFNNDTRYGKQNYTNDTYKWYSLHFLLAKAIQILKETQDECILTYRNTNVRFNESVKNTTVRFGQFASSSYNLNRAKFFGNVSCFEIYTCYGANVTKYSKLPREQEVLIPPYEMFNVTDVKSIRDFKNLRCETVYTLNSTGTQSDLNCALFTRPRS
ncbi:erythroblast NAD(P)(+)--arginine ADP-ribosyltransferase-like [Chanodichthys erythropterus]|uniref:erythroblast NAD(P)(+)--arginine ADP-ribosyltransferase-like n=1 Tax=Megalobrama amblycephala TaxID=75352 RepID=UPI002013D4C3|nr:erythroblast NAD(P)(+)--arginine ADP-ribosyltransferase-like [Megalobrama amblycephala]